ncbi:MAG: nucleoside kinase [Bacteroidales bacterium]
MKEIRVICENNNEECFFPFGTKLSKVAEKFNIKLDFPTLGARVNNRIRSLDYHLVKSRKIKFIDYSDIDGQRIYKASVTFVLFNVIKELYPEYNLIIDHGISSGAYCRLEKRPNGTDSKEIKELTKDNLQEIKSKMQEIIDSNIPFTRRELLTLEAEQIYIKQGQQDKAELLKYKGDLFTNLYKLQKHFNNFYVPHLKSTGDIGLFDIHQYFDGFVVMFPKSTDFGSIADFVPQNKYFEVIREHKEWADILQIPTVARLNHSVDNNQSSKVIQVCEALHEKRIVNMAHEIFERKDMVKVILIAGPSASGKTTSSKRLTVQLAVNGIFAHVISLDDYFVNRELTPLDANGDYDFEALEAVDIDFFNKQLGQLIEGQEVSLPRFNFHTGTREFPIDAKLKLGENDVVIVEGIHGLNPRLLTTIDDRRTYKIFISALTQISIDEQNYISSTDNRLLRRMLRDFKYRGYSAKDTIARWPSVKRGEIENIFPYQDNADAVFNSALLYEFGVLKGFIDPILKTVPERATEFSEAQRLLKLLSHFQVINDNSIPPTSLLREFLGGSSFEY